MTTIEQDLINAAKRGDNDAYAQLVAPLRADLHAHCYRLLGSTTDAEDALQEALVGAWRGLHRFEGRSSLRTWLYRIATNACLRAIERKPPRILPIDYGPAGDPHDFADVPLSETIWIEPYPTIEGESEARENVELAFIAALQHLPASQRAVLILRDVLGFSGAETADILGTTTTSVYSSLQRAHRAVESRRPASSQQATLRTLGDKAIGELVKRYADAWDRNDVDAIVEMLSEDASFTMPPLANWYRGRAAIAEFLRNWPLAPDKHWRSTPTLANGQLAFRYDLLDESTGVFVPHSLKIITLRGSQIAEVTAFLSLDLKPWL